MKPSIGLGFWWRQQHELLLLGIRGRMRAPPPGIRFPSVICSPVAAMLEVMFPESRKLEMLARRRRPNRGDEIGGRGSPHNKRKRTHDRS